MRQYSNKIFVLTVLLDVLIALVSIVGAYIFAQVWTLFGLVIDIRWMLIFVVLGVVGAVIMTIALKRNINPLWSVMAFVLPLCAAIVVFVAYAMDSNNVSGLGFFSLPVLAYGGGIALSIYMHCIRKQISKSSVV